MFVICWHISELTAVLVHKKWNREGPPAKSSGILSTIKEKLVGTREETAGGEGEEKGHRPQATSEHMSSRAGEEWRGDPQGKM